MRSAFFKKTLADFGMKESRLNCVQLHDVGKDTLETFLYWIHTREILFADGSETVTCINFTSFVDLYLFADCYDTRELRNSVVKAIYQKAKLLQASLSHKVLGDVLHKLRPSSRLFMLLTTLVSSDLGVTLRAHASNICEYYPKEALGEIIVHLVDQGSWFPNTQCFSSPTLNTYLEA